MEPQNYLGIYLSKNAATAVCLGGKKVLSCFRVSLEDQDRQDHAAGMPELANLLAQACNEKIPAYKDCELAIALDCSLFMQHNVHSEFNEPKQIAQTIRFDTEEALATDISDVAIAFKIASTDSTGSRLTVFTSQQKILSDIILSLQRNNIDPVAIEPDVNCLSRFISSYVLSDDSAGQETLFALLSGRRGYFIIPGQMGQQQTTLMRTLLVNPKQDRTQLLASQIPLTTALVEQQMINHLKTLDYTGSLNYQLLEEKLGMQTSALDLADCTEVAPDTLADCSDSVEFAIACGAALSGIDREQTVNFRSDFMPYEGGKLLLQKTLKFLSIAVIILMLTVGLYGSVRVLQKNKTHARLKEKLAKDYAAVMLGKKLPSKFNTAVKELSVELRRIRSVKEGRPSITGQESLEAKLTVVIEAFNKCAAKTDLNIDSISISEKSISIKGDTSSRKNTLNVFDAIKKTGLNIIREGFEIKGGRDNFNITVELKK